VFVEFKIREQRLKRLKSSIKKFEDDILKALKTDLNKSAAESTLMELYPLSKEIDLTLKNLRYWGSKRRVNTPIALLGTKHYVRPEPKGKVLIISPWNFPIMLTLRPVVSAIAAGNSVVVKPSEHTPNCSNIIKQIVEDVFSTDEVEVVLGGPEIAADLTSKPFNHICFTGGTEIGKKVMRAASENLCSVTLELGGKSPAIIDKEANISQAASRISWGKYLNAGQACIAPDYALVPSINVEVFVGAVESSIVKMYGASPMDSADLGHIVNEKHYKRILSLIKDAVKQGAELRVPGGILELPDKMNMIAPCILYNCTPEMSVMQEEIFGPVLVVMSYDSREHVLELIENNPHPLALYIFSKKRKNVNWWIDNTKSGSTVVNDVVIQMSNPELSFGGIQKSGIGRSNGKAGFDSFSNLRSFVESNKYFSALPLIYPPFSSFTEKLVKTIKRYL